MLQANHIAVQAVTNGLKLSIIAASVDDDIFRLFVDRHFRGNMKDHAHAVLIPNACHELLAPALPEPAFRFIRHIYIAVFLDNA